MAKSNHRNVGIFAHVDAGKTTTTEHMLYLGGVLKSPGNVNNGTTFTDSLDIERQRGISVKAALTSLKWNNHSINLVDTPGHIDFISEVERALRVMDGAILIVSASDGIQGQTETIWKSLRELNIPTLIYVNKMDRQDVNAEDVVRNIQIGLSPNALPVQTIQYDGDTFHGIVPISSDPSESLTEDRSEWDKLTEWLADQDELVLERVINGEQIAPMELVSRFQEAARAGTAFPICFGASQKGIGVEELLDSLLTFLPPPAGDHNAPLSGIVFKIERDKSMGKTAYVRLYQGTLQTRDTVPIANQDIKEKVTQLRLIEGRKFTDVSEVVAGDIAAVFGMQDVRIGDILGSEAQIPQAPNMAVPLLTVQVHNKNESEYAALANALQELTQEDPLLDLQWLQAERELHVKVMGAIQLEILENLLMTRFGLKVTFDEPSVIYKETPASTGEGYIAYTMPKPCWAILRFAIRPLPRGSGLVYRSIVRADHLLERYQNEVARRLPEALQQGLLGWEVTDLEVVLTEGEHHVWHTHPLDFVVATPMGVMDGLNRVKTVLLEPMQHFRITVPEDHGGKVLSDLVHMRATFEAPSIMNGRCSVEGTIPVATSLQYPLQLRSETKGIGVMTTRFAGYEECPEGIEVQRKRRGINPLDQSKYILAARNALGSM
ncbi:TetM/TetW/TetO/TetS family tetracycline resistance ribosomal protection protein [Paenibacillus sp. Marseille-Q4541]|uniref:elongation factor G n=1 Tax=Paenibacillus sp. Marseille-Q4541 TaxID=2831522 RepID=UPI001BAD7B86|nr:TetM/TetW/TetO/TetS family tetracycline resistance ribosomal protection protein [Paenibacillus sp. Marseille-Q4541]